MSSDQHTLAGPISTAPRRTPWSVRLNVRPHAEAFDAALASGTLPGERPELALRARQADELRRCARWASVTL